MSTSPGHKLLVPTLSEGGARPDGEDMMAGGRRRSTSELGLGRFAEDKMVEGGGYLR